eukprot:6906706-Prymnesium_polylepis.1
MTPPDRKSGFCCETGELRIISRDSEEGDLDGLWEQGLEGETATFSRGAGLPRAGVGGADQMSPYGPCPMSVQHGREEGDSPLRVEAEGQCDASTTGVSP